MSLLVGIPLSILFLWLAVRHAHVDAVAATLRRADPSLVAASVVVLLCVYLVQAWRWWGLARGKVLGLSVGHFFGLVLTGLAVNNVVPGRLGDVCRAHWLGKDARIAQGRAVATVVVDRATDVVVLAAALLVSLPFVAEGSWSYGIAGGTVVLVVALFGLLLAACLYARSRPRARDVTRGVVRRVGRDVVDGIAETLSARRVAVAVMRATLAWTAWSAAAILLARSIGFDLSLFEAFFLASVVNLGSAIPSSPGFVGTYQWLVVSALAAAGVASSTALAFAILLHAVWYVPTTVGGGLVLISRALTARRPLAAQRDTSPVVVAAAARRGS
jgi:uncharacterized protein (TIRG00374 family)